ncbi:4'-phosphopantetheinyl transferase superfamily protein [Kitasatospora sp. MMS16-BH015]|uniref:4'-phosphopantetheinyl transferase family protein n=1 Tax=Kitasatospora sp. MMS16-BH015 TaxID=2018025 RepID=UPI000CF2797B|nr:4'-phosphopantetheinyl transferase superfamily protein [Kitasatospora sp. MMS16-BH015]
MAQLRPIRLAGPAGPWAAVHRAMSEVGTAVVYGTVADWAAPAPAERSLALLLGREWARHGAFDSPAERERFAASRRFLKHAAAAVVGGVPEQLELAHRPSGGLHVRGVGRLAVSLSHTEELLVVAVSRRGQLGTDVERGDREVHEATAAITCSPYERSAVRELAPDERGPALLRLWTLKEAYTKAIGQGMRFPFTQFGFDLDGERPRLCWPDGRPRQGGSWHVETHEVPEGYRISVAVAETTDGHPAATVLDPAILHAVRHARLSVNRAA